MVTVKWSPPPLNTDEGRDLFMLTLEDDTEEAPWMVMGDLQFWSASSFAYTLQDYAHAEGLGWYVASMLPITYLWPGSPRKRVLAPDTFVAFVPIARAPRSTCRPRGPFRPSSSKSSHRRASNATRPRSSTPTTFSRRASTPSSPRASALRHLWRATAATTRARSPPGCPTRRAASGAMSSASS